MGDAPDPRMAALADMSDPLGEAADPAGKGPATEPTAADMARYNGIGRPDGLRFESRTGDLSAIADGRSQWHQGPAYDAYVRQSREPRASLEDDDLLLRLRAAAVDEASRKGLDLRGTMPTNYGASMATPPAADEDDDQPMRAERL